MREQPKPEASESYQVTWSEKAIKHLRLLDKPVKKRIVDTVNHLAENPRPPGMKPVIGLPGVFRVREDHCRVLYTVDDDRRTIWIEDVRHRSKVHGDHRHGKSSLNPGEPPLSVVIGRSPGGG